MVATWKKTTHHLFGWPLDPNKPLTIRNKRQQLSGALNDLKPQNFKTSRVCSTCKWQNAVYLKEKVTTGL